MDCALSIDKLIKERQSKRETDRALLSTGSIPKCPKCLYVGQAEARSREFNIGLPHG